MRKIPLSSTSFCADTTGSLKSVSAHYDSMYGRIESSWRVEPDGRTVYMLTVPANTTATLTLPIPAAGRIKVDRRVLSGRLSGGRAE